MCGENIKKRILDEVDRIAQTIILNANADSGHLIWKTVAVKNRDFFYEANPSLYSGVSGIALFLLYAFKVTGNYKYLEVALDSLKWTIARCRENLSDHTFFAGQLGVAYVCCKAYETTGESIFIADALEIARKISLEPHTIEDNDLLLGTSGVIIGLLHIHQRYPEDVFLQKIKELTIKVLNGSHLNHNGLSWDRSGKKIRGLCGFSHGASGIGWLFLELGKYFKNPAFYWVSRQAFNYENFYFDNSKKNWPDFRKGIWSDSDFERHKEEYFRRNNAFFEKPGFMNAWCHGAAGIGFSRLHAWETLKERNYLDEALNCTMKVEEDLQFQEIKTWTLCHGLGGNLDLLIEMGTTLDKTEKISTAQKAALQSITAYDSLGKYLSGYARFPQGEDSSLFMGTAGIGYFYLRALFPSEIDCILAPKLQSEAGSFEDFNISLESIKSMVLNKYFHRSMKYCSNLSPDRKHEHIQKLTQILDDQDQREPRKVVINEALDSKMLELVSLENDVVDMAVSFESGCLTETRIGINNEILSGKIDLDTEALVPKIGSHVRLHCNSDGPMLIVTKPKGFATYELSDFSATLFGVIDGKSSIAMITKRVMDLIPETKHNQAVNLVLEQLKQFMAIGVFDWFV